MGRLSNGPITNAPRSLPNSQTSDRQFPPFTFQPTDWRSSRMSIWGFRTNQLVIKWCNEQSYSFRQSSKWVNADRAQYVQSSSSPITIVAITSFQWHNLRPILSFVPGKGISRFVENLLRRVVTGFLRRKSDGGDKESEWRCRCYLRVFWSLGH